MKEILKKIKEYDTIILHRHQNPDGDAYGSQFGLKYLILDNWPNKKVLAPGEKLEDFVHLGEPDEVTKDDYENALVIITDTANKARIDGEYWNMAQFIIKIDHHPFYEKYGDYEWIDDTACAASLMVGKFAIDNKLKLNKNAAKAIFCGIVTDTGRFVHGNLNSETFRIVSKLYEVNFDWKKLYEDLYYKTQNEIDFQGYIFSNFISSKNGFLYIKNDPRILKKYHLTKEKANSFVNLLSDIEKVKVWAFFSQDEHDQTIKISIRSRYYAINQIAMKYNGGGHKLACGVKVDNWDEVDKIIGDINKMLENSGK